jgi:hypothetical protein
MSTQTSRAEHLAWCKERAKQYATAGDLAGAVASMTSDLRKWDGGEMYDPSLLNMLMMDGIMFRKTPADVTNWIDGFN